MQVGRSTHRNSARAVIIDLDGVLVNSEPLKYESYRRVLEGFSVKLDKTEYQDKGVGAARQEVCAWLVKRFRLPVSPEELGRIRSAAYRTLAHKQKPLLDGVAFVRACAPFLRVAVATSTEAEFARQALSNTGVAELVQFVLSDEDVQRHKPAPDIYLLGARKLNLPPASCVAVEDTAIGIKAARRAGLHCIARPNRFTAGQDFTEADLIVKSLTDPSVFDFLGISRRDEGES